MFNFFFIICPFIIWTVKYTLCPLNAIYLIFVLLASLFFLKRELARKTDFNIVCTPFDASFMNKGKIMHYERWMIVFFPRYFQFIFPFALTL